MCRSVDGEVESTAAVEAADSGSPGAGGTSRSCTRFPVVGGRCQCRVLGSGDPWQLELAVEAEECHEHALMRSEASGVIIACSSFSSC